MIIVTGGAGFIGSALVWRLNRANLDGIVVVDRLGTNHKWKNLAKRNIVDVLHPNELFSWLAQQEKKVDLVFHMGACSRTTEADADYLIENNVHYSMKLFDYCTKMEIPFIYASSAATYGAMEEGFSDSLELIPSLVPINKYGYSKHLFDCWALKQKNVPPLWVGLKFFNVYGPQEYHKDSQASVVFHAYNQILNFNSIKLFKSYREDIKDGEQKRDFVYVKDVVDVMFHIYQNLNKVKSGIYNIGTGKAHTFLDLAVAVFEAMDKKKHIEWIDMPKPIRQHYQYFTQGDLKNLRDKVGYVKPFSDITDGVRDYVVNHLMNMDPYL